MAPQVSIAEVDRSITFLQHSLLSFPRFDPVRRTCLQTLAMARFVRHHLSDQKEDLDKSITHFTEAIFLSFRSFDMPCLNLVQVFFRLASALLRRAKQFEQLEDATYSTSYLRHLRTLPLESFDILRDEVTTSLVHALALQVEFRVGDGMRDIQEMVILCRELLTLDSSAGYPTSAIISLAGAVMNAFCSGDQVQPLDEVIECLREAHKQCPPGLHQVSFAFGSTLTTRFILFHSNDDYEEATTVLDEVIDSYSKGDDRGPYYAHSMALATLLAHARSVIYKNPEYSEEAISRCRIFLNSSSLQSELRPAFSQALAIHTQNRFRHFGDAEALQEAQSCISEVVGISSSQRLGISKEGIAESKVVRATYSMTAVEEKIRHLQECLNTALPGSIQYKKCLDELVDWYDTKVSRTDDIMDIEEAMKYHRMVLASTHSSDPFRFLPLGSLGDVLALAFEHTSKIDYLEESIAISHEILEVQSAQAIHFSEIRRLVSSLSTRLRLLGRRQDLDEIMRLMPMAVNSKYARAPDRFQFSCLWASIARVSRHSSIPAAYESAMTLMQSALFFAPTLEIQHTRLVGMHEICEKMPLDYASYQVDAGKFERAIETLERGRALLWSEMRGLRISLDQLLGADSPLAEKFAAINHELEALTMSGSPSGSKEMVYSGAESREGTDAFGRLVMKQRKLLEERDALISQIQELPGFEGFLKTSSFDTLRTAASRGPVIIINHCKWRSDILILLRNSPPSLIPMRKDFKDHAIELRGRLLGARKKYPLESKQYQRALRSVLEGLYYLVGLPVIRRLRELRIPEQSRVWWCPTSVFCSLPLHAMGPIPSNDGIKRYFSDLYIPSYTPTLSALIESRKPGSEMMGQPSLLLVAQPNASLPGVWGEIDVLTKLDAKVTSLISRRATPTAVVSGLRDHQLAHFACHGTLETGKPFDASFELYGDEHLTLLEIVRSRLPTAEFAFLSACHTAELTDESIADESLHLTAAMQYCGFRSVVGTMWSMADTDGRDLAEYFYGSMFSHRELGVPYYERSAGALRDAVQRLRGKKGITLERWVNFVHYGA
ncbi:CHAT domain-containing protein [Multifurca ochricompacta]|uniref:CHAT domain-containing protein n=1 Tax=Multifurca ochricompacta TaxID=376703 RepID=A0AAD4M173_9AGAM|nr:CHAT domain-containing protein [Multifurca ochricompacta]